MEQHTDCSRSDRQALYHSAINHRCVWSFFFFHLEILKYCFSCLLGNDLPSNAKSQVYPQDKVIPVGASITFCCIAMEGKRFGYFSSGSGNTVVNTTRLSRRTYSAVVVNQQPSNWSGINVFCYSDLKEILYGSVMFAGCKTTNSINNTVPLYRIFF